MRSFKLSILTTLFVMLLSTNTYSSVLKIFSVLGEESSKIAEVFGKLDVSTSQANTIKNALGGLVDANAMKNEESLKNALKDVITDIQETGDEVLSMRAESLKQNLEKLDIDMDDKAAAKQFADDLIFLSGTYGTNVLKCQSCSIAAGEGSQLVLKPASDRIMEYSKEFSGKSSEELGKSLNKLLSIYKTKRKIDVDVSKFINSNSPSYYQELKNFVIFLHAGNKRVGYTSFTEAALKADPNGKTNLWKFVVETDLDTEGFKRFAKIIERANMDKSGADINDRIITQMEKKYPTKINEISGLKQCIKKS